MNNWQAEKITKHDLYKIKKLQPEGWPDISLDFKNYFNHDFCEPVKISIENNIVGIGCSIIFKHSAWIAHIIVDPDYRNKGIGFQIVEFLLKAINEKKIKSVSLIATPLGEPVYQKAGFRFISDYKFFIRRHAWVNTEISKNIINYSSDLYARLIDLDYEISGESRESLIQKYLDNCIVYKEKESIKGYYLPSLGEGAIYAQEEIAGLALMDFKYSRVYKAVIPAENKAGIEFLKQNGFIESSTKGKRMILGDDINWKPNCIYSRIGGNYG